MISFPSSPVIGQEYSYNGRTWTWTGSAWRRVINQGQIVSVFTATETLVDLTIAPIPYTVSPGWQSINYV